MSDPAAEKAAMRKTLFARRKAAWAERDRLDPLANAALLVAIGDAAGRIVAGYHPIRTEIDPTPAMTALSDAGARLCVPVIIGEGLPLNFREWTPGCEMTEGPFKARVPVAGDWLEPDILIVPLVGFDRAGGRLGYGGGYYDRTLARLKAARPTRAIGLAYHTQEVVAVPSEPTDQPLDRIVHEASGKAA